MPADKPETARDHLRTAAQRWRLADKAEAAASLETDPALAAERRRRVATLRAGAKWALILATRLADEKQPPN